METVEFASVGICACSGGCDVGGVFALLVLGSCVGVLGLFCGGFCGTSCKGSCWGCVSSVWGVFAGWVVMSVVGVVSCVSVRLRGSSYKRKASSMRKTTLSSISERSVSVNVSVLCRLCVDRKSVV